MPLPAPVIYESALIAKRKPKVFKRNEEIHNYATRQKNKIRVVQMSSSLAKSGPRYVCGKLFNNIPSDIRNLHYFEKFKASLKEYLTNPLRNF